jgi:ATP-dependent RNA helicase RhlE
MLNESTIVTPCDSWESLNLVAPLLHAIEDEKYATPTPIQAQAIPKIIEGRDILASAQTGTGKTAAFALPILQRLANNPVPNRRKSPRALILTPTRELAVQISDSFRVYGRYLKLSHTTIFGGASAMLQIRSLSKGTDILVATPGRLLDLYEQGHISMDRVEMFVLDEADQMLDRGFLPDIKKIYATIPNRPQGLLFSATLPKEILELTQKFLKDPIKIAVSPPSSTVENIDQRILYVDRENKSALLHSLLENEALHRVLVFARTKHGANNLAKELTKKRIFTEAIHGNKSQAARMAALKKFKSGKVRVLVATDVASRGLDVDSISHVINFELPKEPESYVHRIGRTARAGAKGSAISFCDAGERPYLKRIERTINRSVPVDTSHPFHSVSVANKRVSGDGGDARKDGYRSKNGPNSRFSKAKSRRPMQGRSHTSGGPKPAGAGMQRRRARTAR